MLCFRWAVCRYKIKITFRTPCKKKKKLGITGTTKSGKEKNAEHKKGDKKKLGVTTQKVPRIVITQKLTAVYLFASVSLQACFTPPPLLKKKSHATVLYNREKEEQSVPSLLERDSFLPFLPKCPNDL